jgi:hypothetical protein
MRPLRWRRLPPKSNDALEWTNRPWSRSLVVVCQECDGRGDDFTPPIVLKAAKSMARTVGPKGRARVTGSGCLDVCPKNGVALAISIDGAPTRCAVAHTPTSVAELAEVLR